MRDPFSRFHNEHPGALSGMIDYWVDVVPNDAVNNVLAHDTVASVGVGIRVTGTGGTVSFIDRHGVVRTETIDAGDTLTTSVLRIRATGTAATGIKVALAPT